jgi:serine/threonine-protein kinase
VHRDFTPQNILVGTDGVARLTDFGIARAASRLVRTRTGDVKGKARYMSPEQARGLRLDRRCDVWAAGVMAWEILAEQPLFAADNELAMLLRIASDPVPLLSEARPDLGTAFDAALSAALTRDVAERCPDARELAQRLRAACDRAGLAIAGTEAVAETVQRLAGAKLAERAARVTEVVAVQARMREIDSAVAADDGTESAPPLAQSTKLRHQPPTVLAPHDADTDSTLVTDGGPRRRARLAGAGAAAAAALVLALVLAWRAVGARGEAGAGATPASGNAASAAALAPLPSSSAPPPPTAVAATQLPAPLAVFADALIVELRIGTRVVPVQPPSNGKVVERTAAEGGAPLDISAIASDGRSATAVASPESTSVHLVFPPRNKPVRDAPRAPPRAPELSPNPF